MSKEKVEFSNLKFQKLIVTVGILVFLIKITAWYLTQSLAIYSDALESVVNIVSALIGLFSIYLATKPKDTNHPYGHGKIEFISSAIEGILIFLAGLLIILETILNLFDEKKVQQLDYGIILITFCALVNFILGYFAVQKGKKSKSIALESSGKHLLTDTYSTFGILIGLILISIFKFYWIDALVALIFSVFILYAGYKIIRNSLSGIMDEADEKLIKEVIVLLNKTRRVNWIDLHNLRIIKYGSHLHFDLHITLPYYLTVREAHEEIDLFDNSIKAYFGNNIEFFIHTDPCVESSCKICMVENCKVRTYPFEKQLDWNFKNVSDNSKHALNS